MIVPNTTEGGFAKMAQTGQESMDRAAEDRIAADIDNLKPLTVRGAIEMIRAHLPKWPASVRHEVRIDHAGLAMEECVIELAAPPATSTLNETVKLRGADLRVVAEQCIAAAKAVTDARE